MVDVSAEPKDDAQQRTNGQETEPRKERVAHQLVRLVVPILFLVILYAIFFSLAVFSAQVLNFTIPDQLKLFLFLSLFMVSLAVFFSQVLREVLHIRHNGVTVAGTLAFVIAFGYGIINFWPALAAAFPGILPPNPSLLDDFTLAEVRLDCQAVEDIQTENIYAFVAGGSTYISNLRAQLEKYKSDKIYDFEFIQLGNPRYEFFENHGPKGGSSSWIAYSISQRDHIDRLIPVPTQLDREHRSAFFVDSVASQIPTGNSESDLGDVQNPSAERGELIEIAQVTIEPGVMTIHPDWPPKAAEDKIHKVKITLNLNGSKTPCWSRAITRAGN